MRNYCINGSFDVFDARSGVAATTAAWVAKRWLFGPGVNGVASWSIRDFDAEKTIPGNPRHYLHLEWTQAPTEGENPPTPRFTFLENHGLRDARQLHGCFVDVTWWLRVNSGTVPIMPIVWQNFTNGDYVIHSGETYPVRDFKGWHPLTQTIYIPEVPQGKAVDTTSYLGMGLDFIILAGPILDVACVSTVRKTVEIDDPQVERIKATGQFWN